MTTNSHGSTSVGAGPGNDRNAQSQQETGGNGGEQLTASTGNNLDGDTGRPAAPAQRPGTPESDATASNRTAQDTRANQAGSTGTGLGAAETGGNQDEFDMPKE